MRKTFRQILQKRSDLDLSSSAFDELIDLFQQIKESTIKECQTLSKLKYLAGETGYLSKESVLQLDKNSIEIL